MNGNSLDPRVATPRLARGFGLIELVVSIGIMVLVTTIVMANHGSFAAHSLLRTQAYDMALRIREVQQTAVSVSSQDNAFDRAYGVRFQNGARDRLTVFSVGQFATNLPLTGAGAVATSGLPEILDRRFEVTCVERKPSGAADFDPDCRATTDIYIMYRRPNFDAQFFDETGAPLSDSEIRFTIGARGTGDYSTLPPTDLRVRDNEFTITVTRSGQISVLPGDTP